MTSEAWIPVRIARRWSTATDIAAFELVADGPAMLPAFEAGAHVDVEVGPGLVRQYSICNDPAERHRYVIGVLRAPGSRGGSLAVHERLQAGAVIRIRPPRNLFPLEKAARHHLLLAGGIGVTPLLAMAKELLGAGASFHLHYFARSKARAAFLDELQAQPLAGHTTLHFDDEAAEPFDLRACLASQVPGTHGYVCGPGGFMQFVGDAAQAAGWPSSKLHREFFTLSAAAAAGADRPFDLVLARSARVIVVASDQTALQALRAAGIDVPSSCESGLCGTCLTTVLEGVPDHRDSYLTDSERAEGGCFLPCCSRALGEQLTIDL